MTHDLKGRKYARLSTLKPGDNIFIDDGFINVSCKLKPWSKHVVRVNEDEELYISCAEGQHNLEGQCGFENPDVLIGIYPEEPNLMSQQTATITQFFGRKATKASRSVPFTTFEPLFHQLVQATGASQIDCIKLIGFTSGSCVANWKAEGLVPTVAYNAVRWILHELQVTPSATNFSFDELTIIFGLANRFAVPEDQRRALIAKLVGALSNG